MSMPEKGLVNDLKPNFYQLSLHSTAGDNHFIWIHFPRGLGTKELLGE